MKYKIFVYSIVIFCLIFGGYSCKMEHTSSNEPVSPSKKVMKKPVFKKHPQPIITEVPFNLILEADFQDKESIEKSFGISLSSLQESIDKKGLPLHPERFLPLPKSPDLKFNDKVWQEFLAKLSEKNQQALLKNMYAKKQLITYKMFAQGLNAVMQKFPEFVPENYAVAVLYEENFHWASSIASIYLAKDYLPKYAWLPQGFGEHYDDSMKNIQDIDVEHYVIILDAEFNGETLDVLLKQTDEKKCMKGKRVIVFAPFISKEARRILEKKWFKKITVEIITTDFDLVSVFDTLRDENIKPKEPKRENNFPHYDELLAKHPEWSGFILAFKENMRSDKSPYDSINEEKYNLFDSFFSARLDESSHRNRENQVLVYTEWEIPHRSSFFLKYLQETVFKKYGMSGQSFLPKIIPPYKNFK